MKRFVIRFVDKDGSLTRQYRNAWQVLHGNTLVLAVSFNEPALARHEGKLFDISDL